MKTVIVVISAYKGAKHIERQLDSIFEQIGVDVQVWCEMIAVKIIR